MVFDCSVIIPLYNKSAYIERALRSVASQACRPREIIVVDDGSRDDGAAKVAAFAETLKAQNELSSAMPPIILIRQENAGVSAARNRGIGEASGDWVAFLDADDVYLPWFFEELIELARLRPDADLIATNFAEVAGDFDAADVARAHGSGEQGQTISREVVADFFDRWWRGSFFFTSSVCVRRSVLDDFGTPFKVGEQHGEDLDLFFRIAEDGILAWSPRVSSIYAIGVPDSLMHGGTELSPVPAFERLKARAQSGQFPGKQLSGAQRVVATYWMTIARARIEAGDVAGAWALLSDPVTRHRPIYWLRTAAITAASAVRRAVPLKTQGLTASSKTQKSKP